mmetsp:Transcript_34787/g.90792  ORF Transcript_34787/g.90792 Transcript_34787/m.90792 type:complete len:268 (-) Transcript_34787:379-1182(-)
MIAVINATPSVGSIALFNRSLRISTVLSNISLKVIGCNFSLIKSITLITCAGPFSAASTLTSRKAVFHWSYSGELSTSSSSSPSNISESSLRNSSVNSSGSSTSSSTEKNLRCDDSVTSPILVADVQQTKNLGDWSLKIHLLELGIHFHHSELIVSDRVQFHKCGLQRTPSVGAKLTEMNQNVNFLRRQGVQSKPGENRLILLTDGRFHLGQRRHVAGVADCGAELLYKLRDWDRQLGRKLVDNFFEVFFTELTSLCTRDVKLCHIL